MGDRTVVGRIAAATAVAVLATSVTATGAAAHLGESGHVHAPGDSSVHTSSVWCVQFTQDPGVWRPDGETAVDGSLLEGVSVVFVDCAELLADHYAIESFADGSLARSTVNEPVIGMPDGASDAGGTPDADSVSFITAAKWAKHQKAWLAKGDRLANRTQNIQTLRQARKALGALQKHLKAETTWLRENKRRFEPGSCVAVDMALWKKHVGRAQKSLNKAVTAMNRGNVAAMTTQARQSSRSFTKLEQIYNQAVCDF